MSRSARPSPPPPPPLLLKSRKSLTFLFLFVLFLAQQATLDYDDDDGQTQKSRIPLIQGAMKMMMLPMIDDPTKRGLLFATLSYLVYSFLQGPDTHMSRPHPGVWRVAHGSFVLYLLFLVFLVFQETKESARANVFEYLAPNLKVSSSSSSLGEEGTTNNGGGGLYEERTYATDCRIFTPESSASSRMQNVKNTILDEFFLAHVLGWFGKALAIRDWRLLWAYSILFELMEVTFRHWLKNFNECWWDSWVLDVLICNFGGMWVGMRATKYFATSNDRGSHSGSSREESSEEDNRFMNGEIAAENREENSSEEEEEYDIDDTEEHEKSKKSSSALSKRTKENESGGQNDRHHRRRPSSNFVRVARKSIENYILPEKGHNWYRYEWQPFKTPGRFIQCVFLIGMCLSFELNAFFLKFIYAIPPPHILNTLRLTLWFAQANIAIREYYVFITDESGIWKAQLGANAWLAIAAMAMEFLVILKHGDGLFTAKWPKAVVRCWLAVGVAMVGGLTVWQFRMRSSSDEKKERKRKTKMI
jgi:hypothetical protein